MDPLLMVLLAAIILVLFAQALPRSTSQLPAMQISLAGVLLVVVVVLFTMLILRMMGQLLH